MNDRRTTSAELPPRPLPGLDPAWSRLVTTMSADGTERAWHVLDSHPTGSAGGPDPVGTLLCVHGNPTWSYLWRSVVAAPPAGWRVVAPDHLGMGYSDRADVSPRRFTDRVRDLSVLTEALDLTGPVVTVGHDWGGAISLGWALEHRAQLSGIVLTNTAVSQPTDEPAPAVIRLARANGLRQFSCVATTAFLDGTLALAHPRLSRAVRSAYRSPYRRMSRRQAIGDFVEDIPLDPAHPSSDAVAAVAEGIRALVEVPALLLWGPRDPVFSDRYLRDMVGRLPHADVHRFARAGHLVPEDADVAGAIRSWLEVDSTSGRYREPQSDRRDRRVRERVLLTTPARRRPVWAELERRSSDLAPAVITMRQAASKRAFGSARRPPSQLVSFALLARRVRQLAAGLAGHGVRSGDRVAILVPPGADLIASVYACWRIGAVVVLIDAGLGVRGMSGALAAANPAYLIGIPRALAAARVLGWPGEPILASAETARIRSVAHRLGATTSLSALVAQDSRPGTAGPAPDTDRTADVAWSELPAEPGADATAAVVFTSGATGPAKGVVYDHEQLEAQRDLLAATYGIDGNDRLVAAFAPFAVYGPALGIPTVVPAMIVTSPGTLSASALAAAVAAVDATLVFASPAALVNVRATASALTGDQKAALDSVRLVLSAGAPVPVGLMRWVSEQFPNAEPHSPYGMTEVLPVTDVSLTEIEAAGDGHGVCVGNPVGGVRVAIAPLDALGQPADDLTDATDVLGEICVAASHAKRRYDGLWWTEHASIATTGWHRTGDVGHLDDEGRLWVEGRLVHVVTTSGGVVTPVPLEQRVEALNGVAMAAAVGVGPPGAQAVVLVVVSADKRASLSGGPLAGEDLGRAVRAAVSGDPASGAGSVAPVDSDRGMRHGESPDVAAVLVVRSLPVDIRHNSKIDRSRVARWADRVLSGHRPGRI